MAQWCSGVVASQQEDPESNPPAGWGLSVRPLHVLPVPASLGTQLSSHSLNICTLLSVEHECFSVSPARDWQPVSCPIRAGIGVYPALDKEKKMNDGLVYVYVCVFACLFVHI